MAVQGISIRWQSWTLSILLALLPLSFSITRGIKVLPPALLFLAGIYLLFTSAEARDCFRRSWMVIGCIVLLIVYNIGNVLGHRLGVQPLDHAAHVLLYLIVAAVFTRRLQLKLIWAGFSATAVAFGILCMVQRYGMHLDRAHSLNGGASSAIEFAMIMLALALVALVQLLLARCALWERMLHGAGLLFGVYGALLTQSRGPLLAFAPIFLLVIVLATLRTRRWRSGVLMIVLVGVGSIVAISTVKGNIVSRFAAIDQVISSEDAPAGNAPAIVDKAIDERLEMWHAAERAIRAHPWSGIGIDEFQNFLRGEIAAGRSDPSIIRFNHPHNEYLEATTNGGIPGLLCLLLVFAVPLAYFVRQLRHRDETVGAAAITGVAIIGLYMLCSLTDSVFYRVMSQSLYFFLVPGFALLIARSLRMHDGEPAADD
jgi:O-antigen ligase